MTNVAVAIQVYDLTHSSFYVGLVGVFALVPLIALGLYGGAIADAVDRRTLALVASAGLWLVSMALAAQAFAGNASVWPLYACIAVQSGFYAVNNPARSAMVPRLLDKELLPAAAALNMASFNLGFTFGPVHRSARDQLAGLRRGVHHRRHHVLRRLLRADQAAAHAADGRQPARRVSLGRGRPAFPPSLAEPADDVHPRPLRDGARAAAGAVPGARLQGVRRRRRRGRHPAGIAGRRGGGRVPAVGVGQQGPPAGDGDRGRGASSTARPSAASG